MVVNKDGTDPEHDLTMDRLTWYRDWYDRVATRHRVFFMIAKVASLLIASTIPVLSGFGDRWFTLEGQTMLIIGVLGASIVVIEGLLRLFQSEQHWLRYRMAWLALDREKALFVARAGPYATAEDPWRLLAENLEMLISQENQAWTLLQRERKNTDSKQ